MIFKKHSELKDMHSFLSASSYHWINYDVEKLKERYRNELAKAKGTILHNFASQCILLGQKLPDNQKTLNMFVNDAIGFKMESEQILYYSEFAFGTADAISFRNNMLRIHDLKTGKEPASIKQLLVYAAYFCLEYNHKPSEIDIELRIYQNDDVIVYVPAVDEIVPIMDTIITFDKELHKMKREESGL